MGKLLIAAVAAQVAAIVCGIILAFVGKHVCMTKKCHKLAEMVSDFIKTDQKPCDDFYQYACGKMLESTDSERGLINQVNDLLLKKMVQYLDEVKKDGKPEAFYSLQVMHNQCRERHESPKEIKANIKLLVDDCTGGFPARDGAAWDEAKFKLHEVMRGMREKGLLTGAFFAMTFKRSPVDPTTTLMSITPPKPYISFRPAFLATCNEDCRRALKFVYKKVLVTAGVPDAEAEKEADDLLYLDMTLANLTYNKPTPLPHDYKDNIVTVENFIATYDYFDWNYYFNYMTGVSDLTATFPKDKKVIVYDPDYLDSLRAVLANATTKQQANYVVWHNLLNFLYYPELPRTDNFCTDMFIAVEMPELMTALATRVRDDSNAPVANRVIQRVGDELMKEVKRAPWMGPDTRQKAINKLKNLEIKIGYFPVFLDNDLIDEYFNFSTSGESGKLNVGINFYYSYRAVWMNKVQRENYCYKNEFTPKLCQLMVYGEMNLVSNKMFYDPMTNSLVVADSMLREPLFFKFWPNYMYFSRFGFIIAHEMTHTMDSVGRWYDPQGKFNDWWGEKAKNKYFEREKCFLDQVSQFKFFNGNDREPIPVNMSLTEDIADVAGFFVAYRAFKKAEGILPGLMLPGLDYTPEQLFFISLAQTFCSAYKAFEYPVAFWGVHLPNSIRVNEILQNSPEFSQEFQCERETDMNPSRKCMLF